MADTERTPFIPDEPVLADLYAEETKEIEEIDAKLIQLVLLIQSEEQATADGRPYSNPAFDQISLPASINDLSLDDKKDLKADLELRRSQLHQIIAKDKKNPIVIQEERDRLDEIETQKWQAERDRRWTKGAKWTIGIGIGFGLLCIMIPAVILLLIKEGKI